MFIRAGMTAYLDKSTSGLDTISAEPLRVWRVTGSDEAIEAFRTAVGGVVVPDEDVVAVQDAAVVAVKITEKKEQVAVLQASLDAATVELTDLQKVVTAPAVEELVAGDIVAIKGA